MRIIGRVIQISKDEEIPTSQGANRLVKQRLESARSIKSMYRPLVEWKQLTTAL